MRVAIWVVLSFIFSAAASAGAAPAVEASVSYPAVVSSRNVAASQDAIKPSATQQRRASSALPAKTSGTNFAASARARADALEFDRRLASLDPSHIVYEQSLSQAPLAQAGLLDLNNGRLFPRQEQRQPPRQQARSTGDFLLMGFAALMLIAYQLRKKHRVLRPQPFSY